MARRIASFSVVPSSTRSRSQPPNATIDAAVERLVFLAKIETGLAEFDSSDGVSHEEAKRRFGL